MGTRTPHSIVVNNFLPCKGEGKAAFFSAKCWNHRYGADLIIESPTPYHDAYVVMSYWVSNPLRLAVLAAKSEDYTTPLRHNTLLKKLNLIFEIDYCSHCQNRLGIS